MQNPYLHMDPFLAPVEAENMLRVAESFGSFGTYAEEATSEGLGETLPQRFDVALQYLAHGLDGCGNQDAPDTAASRTNYFRETYIYGDEVKVDGVEPFISHPQMSKAARNISGCDEVVPAILYANLLVPGQELAIHTDVPEFRGINRKNAPQWLLVCMLHSGLFEGWRIPILTCVSWYGTAEGGAFTFYPQGAQGSRAAIPAKHNSAIIIDTDRVFHGVERVSHNRPEVPMIGPGTRLHFLGEDDWELRSGAEVLGRYRWSQVRYSVSWKAYCFADMDARKAWETHSEDLTVEQVLDVFRSDLRGRGLLQAEPASPDLFAQLMVETYVHFP